jgi:ATP-dependent helicase Lhr and Lhr-like helicase
METSSEGFDFVDPPLSGCWLDEAPEPLTAWFRRRYGEPTAIQRAAWSRLPSGQHLLLSAPTGTGKTLAAFLPILDHLIQRDEPKCSSLTCLYVAPLKALSADTQRTLTAHLEELREVFPQTFMPRVAVRSGDSTPVERRQMRRHPPDILLTTPESVAVLLSQPLAQQLFAGLRWVVVDEAQALAASKRGADLALSLERLTALAKGRLQRIGLSATATPVTEAARWLVGAASRAAPQVRLDSPDLPASERCAIAQAEDGAPLHLTLIPLEESGPFLANLVDQLKPEILRNRSTLVFTNSRRLAEQLGWALRRNLPEMRDQIAVHHSSLAAQRRREVEEAFKQDQLRAVISSTSLELGIDIGAIDLAVLVHPPGDVIRLLQRIGRSGHSPGRIKRGLVLTATDAELLESAVTAVSAHTNQCEPLRIPEHPLDVLCQHILGMAAAQTCSADAVFDLVRRAAPYRHLARRDFDDCLAYLGCGPIAAQPPDGERPWLPPRLRGDPSSFTILNQRTARLLRRNLGTIVADPVYDVCMSVAVEKVEHSLPECIPRRSATGPQERSIGQVDRAFAERLHPGDRFLLDGRCLQVRSLRPEESLLRVEEVAGRPIVPRWGGAGWPLSTELAQRLYLLRVQAAEAMHDGPGALAQLLRRDYGLEDVAVAQLAMFFQRQVAVSDIPDTTSLLIEIVARDDCCDCYVHTPLNRLGNDALARVAVHRLARVHGCSSDSVSADLGFALFIRGHQLPNGSRMAEMLRMLLAASDFEADLEASLEDSAVLRERFQCVAQTGLMLLRQPLGQPRRVGGRDWGGRRLFDKIRARDRDFVLLRQARREIHGEWCDSAAAGRFVRQFEQLPLHCRRLSYPSPFVESWTQMGTGAAERVETPAETLLRLHASLLEGTSDARRA